MTINWCGQSCFKIINQGGHLTIIIDPFDKGIGLNPPRGNADIVIVSHGHSDHNNVKSLSGEPFVIDGPGEYEVKGASIIGCPSFHDKNQGKDRGINTIYLIEVDKIRLCHLGDFGEGQLTDKQLEVLGQVDILMVPVGGTYTIDAREAAKITEQLEPTIIIPMHYQISGLTIKLAGVQDFLKEMGLNKVSAIDKLVLKKKDLANKKMEVAVLKL